jgi:hypothetical protein
MSLLAGYAEPNVRLRLADLRRPGGRPVVAYSVSHSLDDPGELRLLSRYLTAAGHTVHPARDGAEVFISIMFVDTL